jgi:hypothetical protein
MPEQSTLSGDGIAQQAMENLVNQFARPMDFLRELAQNSMDAGTPRVDVVLTYESDGSEGVLSIAVIDYGEGMDEGIIDNQLTRLFSSNKEEDLTKIGKFGIGFTSVFAIKPDAVLLHTGRHGEYWEILFHPDRSFEKRSVEIPYSGTKVTLFKRMSEKEALAFASEAEFVLTYWCEHAQIPIYFESKLSEPVTSESAAPSADPFAAFESDGLANTKRIDRPLGLSDAACVVDWEEDDFHVVMGYTASPQYGFYSGGLTLVSSDNPDVLGGYFATLGHLTFKLKSDALEHTLTRDNVLKDDQWERLMGVLKQAHQRLRKQLASVLARQVASGEDLTETYGHLAAELCFDEDGASLFSSQERRKQPLFFDMWGEPINLAQLEQQESRYGAVFTHPQSMELAEALQASGIRLVPDTPAVVEMVSALTRPPIWGLYRVKRLVVNAAEWFVLPGIVELAGLALSERRFVEMVDEWVQFATRKGCRVRVGAFGEEEEAPLVVMGPTKGRLFQRLRKNRVGHLVVETGDAMLLNRQHPVYGSLLTMAAEEPIAAAYTLVVTLFQETGTGPKQLDSILLGALTRMTGQGDVA